MKHMRDETLTGAQNRYKRLEALGRLAEIGQELPEGLRAPFALRWDADRSEARIMLRETLLARVRPWHRDSYNGPIRPSLLTRTGLPEEAIARIHNMIAEACEFAEGAHAAVKEMDRRRQAEAEANRPPAAAPTPPRLFKRVVTDRAGSTARMSLRMPVGATACALSGIAALNPTANLVLERGHNGQSFRFMVKDDLIADMDVSVRVEGLEEEVCDIAIKQKMGRKLDPVAMETELAEGLAHWNRTFSETGLVRSIDALAALPSIDVLSVRERTGARNPKISHEQRFGDLSVSGVGLGYTLSLKYRGLTFASFIMADEVGDLTGKVMPITNDVMGNATWIVNRDLTSEIEARWRCGAYRLDPEDFPGIQNQPDLML